MSNFNVTDLLDTIIALAAVLPIIIKLYYDLKANKTALETTTDALEYVEIAGQSAKDVKNAIAEIEATMKKPEAAALKKAVAKAKEKHAEFKFKKKIEKGVKEHKTIINRLILNTNASGRELLKIIGADDENL